MSFKDSSIINIKLITYLEGIFNGIANYQTVLIETTKTKSRCQSCKQTEKIVVKQNRGKPIS